MQERQFQRTAEPHLVKLSRQFPAIVLTGARQVGKTTLLRRAFSRHRYVSLDLPSAAEFAETDPEAFLAAYPPPICIDEVQYAPALFRYLKVAIDGDRHEPGRFILTGSQKFSLMKDVGESLAGRCAIVELEPLSLAEIREVLPDPLDTRAYAQLMVRGLFPELWRDPGIDTTVYHSSYVSTYLERDVRQLVNVTSLRDFERFLRACAGRNGQLLEKSALAADVGVSLKTIQSWLSVLQASNQVILLEPWFANIRKRLVKTPKLYFTDTGTLCFLLGLTAESLPRSPLVGGVWETFVFSELRKGFQASGTPVSSWFYREAEGREVDFLFLSEGTAHLYECKWKQNPDVHDARALEELMDMAEARKIPDWVDCRSFVVCRPGHGRALTARTRAIDLIDLLRKTSWRPSRGSP